MVEDRERFATDGKIKVHGDHGICRLFALVQRFTVIFHFINDFITCELYFVSRTPIDCGVVHATAAAVDQSRVELSADARRSCVSGFSYTNGGGQRELICEGTWIENGNVFGDDRRHHIHFGQTKKVGLILFKCSHTTHDLSSSSPFWKRKYWDKICKICSKSTPP